MGSLVLFESFSRRDAFRHAAGLHITDRDQFDDAYKIDSVRVEPFRNRGGDDVVVYMAVPRAHGGISGFVTCSCRLIAAFRQRYDVDVATHQVYVYHSNAAMASLLFGDRVTGVNVDVAHAAYKMGLDPMERPNDDATRAMTRRALGSPLRIVFRTARAIFEQQQRNGIGMVDDDDTELQAALLESERADQERRAAAAKVRIPFKREWSAIVHEQGDDVVPGQPVCLVCPDKRASICFVDCGHQVLCDACVRTIWERTDLKHECPTCRSACTQVARPIVSSLKEADEVVPKDDDYHGDEKKRACKKMKITKKQLRIQILLFK